MQRPVWLKQSEGESSSNEVREVIMCEHGREEPDCVQIISMLSWSEYSVV